MKLQPNPWYQPFITQETQKPVATYPTRPSHLPTQSPLHPTQSKPAYQQPPVVVVTPKPVVVEGAYEIVQPHHHNHHHHQEAAFAIQRPVMSYTGEIIIENTVGGLNFDCRGLPTGHWRDPSYCDVFHACVHGYHRKSYACPIVGHRTYFDEHAQKCEFAHFNPNACSSQKYFK